MEVHLMMSVLLITHKYGVLRNNIITSRYKLQYVSVMICWIRVLVIHAATHSANAQPYIETHSLLSITYCTYNFVCMCGPMYVCVCVYAGVCARVCM